MNRKLVLSITLIIVLVGMLGVAFKVEKVMAIGTIYIYVDGSIGGPANATDYISTNDTVTYYFRRNIQSDFDGIVVERNNIIINGNGYTLQGETDCGFFLSERNNVTIKNTRIVGFSTGIGLYASSNNTISNNTLISNRWFGISIQGASIIRPSNNNTIINNTVTQSVCGLQFHGLSEYNNIIDTNEVYLNDIGIQLSQSSRYTTFCGNAIFNNYYGLMIMDAPEANYGNKIFHNNFINNTHQAVDNGTRNIWDNGYPSGGNYWSDYTDVDVKSGPYQNETESDGIWDHPYIIDENNQDNYPIVPEFPSFLILPLFMMATLLAVIVYKRKHAM